MVLPEEGHHPPALGRDAVDVAVEVPHHGVHVEAGVLARPGRWPPSTGCRRSRRAARSAAGGPAATRASSSTRDLSHVPAPSSTRVSAPDRGGDLRRVGLEQRPLGPGRVVLLEPGDLVEQGTAPVVVEPDRRQPLGRGREPDPHVVLERGAQVVAGQVDVDRWRGGRVVTMRPLSSRGPGAARRRPSGPRAGRSCGRWRGCGRAGSRSTRRAARTG